ncbi:Mitochondrial protein, partial [Globisporangium splendens]
MASRAAVKSSKWLSDPSTYPLIACITVGAVMCASVGVRHLVTSPDVKWNREVRKSKELASKEQTSWMSHRNTLKNLRENPVNALHPANK